MLILLIGILLLTLLFYKLFIIPTNYWKEKGVFHVSGFKRFVQVYFNRKSFFEHVLDFYKAYPDKRYYGSYQFLQPALFVRDLDLIKQITVKDFEYFTDHFSFFNQKSDPILGQNLFELKGEKWKDMRATLSPAFTSSKMKGMYTFIQETAENFANHFYDQSESFITLDIKNAFCKFTNDVIATCAFGMECNSLKNENDTFFSMGNQITTPSGFTLFRLFLGRLFPKIFEIFKVTALSEQVLNFFRHLVKETMETREKNNIIRPDMLHLLMEARKGRLKHDSEKSEQDTGYSTVKESYVGISSRRMELTDDLITAQAVVFFIAGFDTSSTLLSFISHQLAVNRDIQNTLQQEVDQVMSRCKGKVSYEEIMQMKYLDQVVSETLRRYPLGYVLTRQCVKDYKIEACKRTEKSLIIESGTIVTIPVVGIHMDRIYFSNPEIFDPERFSEENKKNIIPGSFMPFGSGPRSCIGSRFALLECKALIVYLLAKFDIEVTKETRIPIRFAKVINLTSKDGFWLGLKKRKNFK